MATLEAKKAVESAKKVIDFLYSLVSSPILSSLSKPLLMDAFSLVESLEKAIREGNRQRAERYARMTIKKVELAVHSAYSEKNVDTLSLGSDVLSLVDSPSLLDIRSKNDLILEASYLDDLRRFLESVVLHCSRLLSEAFKLEKSSAFILSNRLEEKIHNLKSDYEYYSSKLIVVHTQLENVLEEFDEEEFDELMDSFTSVVRRNMGILKEVSSACLDVAKNMSVVTRDYFNELLSYAVRSL